MGEKTRGHGALGLEFFEAREDRGENAEKRDPHGQYRLAGRKAEMTT